MYVRNMEAWTVRHEPKFIDATKAQLRVCTSITEKGVIVGSNSWIQVVIAEMISTVIIQNGAESNWVDHRRHTKS